MSEARRQLDLGMRQYSRKDLEAAPRAGETIHNRAASRRKINVDEFAAAHLRLTSAKLPRRRTELRTELLSSSGDQARIDKGLLASLKANSMPRLTAGLFL